MDILLHNNFLNEKKSIFNLRYKIYTKQKYILEKIYNDNIDFFDKSIKTYIDEINILEIVLDIRTLLYKNDLHNFIYKTT